MIKKGVVFLVTLCLAVVGLALTPATYITKADRDRFKAIFLAAPVGDSLESLAYTVSGLAALDINAPEPQKYCEIVKKQLKSTDVSSVFFASIVVDRLKKDGKPCEVNWGNAVADLTASIVADASPITIYHSVAALSNIGQPAAADKVVPALDAALKGDDSPLGYAYAFFTASHLTGDLKKYHDMIEDIVAQADEVDEKYLQFEGGLLPTAQVIEAAYRSSVSAKLAPTLSEDKVIKFANYLLNRKHTESVKDASYLLAAIKAITSSQFHIPISVTLASSVSVSEKNPLVKVHVNDLMGKSIEGLTVTADTARHIGDDAVVLSKSPLAPSGQEQSLYELDLMKVKPERGFYRITVSVATQQPNVKLLGNSGAEVEVKVITQVSIDNMEVSVADKEQGTVQKSTKVQHPSKVSLEADYHQRLTARFTLTDKVTKKTMTAHQTFVRLTNVKTKQEVIFVAEEDGSDAYKFDLDVGAKAKEFNSLSGKYTMDLIVGDAVIENPVSWTMAEIQLTFHDDATSTTSDQYRYSKRPEIKHLFREPEKRPPVVVSNLFTGLVLLPLLILVICWLKIGVNISHFPCSLAAIGFHVGLGAIFGLYACYFLHLNMFVTLKYLGLIGIPTFLFGNKLLSTIAARRK
jgi:oligosaccharyltransferase complex subunit delta (ribophorin II)